MTPGITYLSEKNQGTWARSFMPQTLDFGQRPLLATPSQPIAPVLFIWGPQIRLCQGPQDFDSLLINVTKHHTKQPIKLNTVKSLI